jgi:queuosine precursor transporter
MTGSTAIKTFETKKTNLFIILCGIFLTNAIVAEIIGVKIFSGETAIGIAPVGWRFFGDYVLDFNLTSGALIWPMVFITTDLINEYYGKKGVRKISFITAFFILYVFLIIALATSLPPAQFWLEVNSTDSQGNAFDINYAFNLIFRQGLGIIFGSLVAFLLGQLIDVYVFQQLRKITGAKMIWVRATGSTLISQFIDSFVVLGIAFYMFGNWSWKQVVAVGIINYIYKFTVALILTPLLYLGHHLIDRYLGKEVADQMTEEASSDTSFI